MRHPGREFGSETPNVIYVALRWNGTHPTIAKEERMLTFVAKKLRLKREDLRIYNLVPPSKGLGMSLSTREFKEVEKTVYRIKQKFQSHPSVHHIVVGGTTGPMPLIGFLLSLLLPKVRIELRSHHKARMVSGGPLKLVRIIRM